MSQQIVPGPCLPEGCPPPTQIDCIQVTKVYDSCFQTESFNNVCAPLPSLCSILPGATVSCDISASSCSFVSSTPTGVDDFYNVTFAVSLTENITITNPSGAIACCFTVPINFLKTVTLCAPEGTTQQCTVAATNCGPCAIINESVCCSVVVCLTFQSVADVQLLVPTYGFCVPSPCSVLGLPPCPPAFPTQCTPLSGSGSGS